MHYVVTDVADGSYWRRGAEQRVIMTSEVIAGTLDAG